MSDPAYVSTPVDVLRLAGGLLWLVRTLDQQVRAARPDDALNLADLGVLRQVGCGCDAPSLIARALRLDPARITHITDRLVALGYIDRGVDPDDRRRWRIRLTDQGADRVAHGNADIETAMQQLVDDLDDAEVSGLMAGLEGVRRVLASSHPAE